MAVLEEKLKYGLQIRNTHQEGFQGMSMGVGVGGCACDHMQEMVEKT